MHPDTIAALRQLAKALIEHPEDAKTLRIYGQLPAHLVDVMEDFGEES